MANWLTGDPGPGYLRAEELSPAEMEEPSLIAQAMQDEGFGATPLGVAAILNGRPGYIIPSGKRAGWISVPPYAERAWELMAAIQPPEREEQ